jgi:hypothetical protein
MKAESVEARAPNVSANSGAGEFGAGRNSGWEEPPVSSPPAGDAWGFHKAGQPGGTKTPSLLDPGVGKRVHLAIADTTPAQNSEADASGIGSVPGSLKTAPPRINLGQQVNGRIQKHSADSQEASEKNAAKFGKYGQEYGGTICKTRDGKLLQADTQIGQNPGVLPMDLGQAPKDCKLLGFFHYHPVLDAKEQHGHAFSGKDFMKFASEKELNAFVVQSKGGKQFALLRTGDTPAVIEPRKAGQLNDRYLDRVSNLMRERGMSVGEASQIAASEMAKYGTQMAYYEGKDGVLERVDRELPDAKSFWEQPYDSPGQE